MFAKNFLGEDGKKGPRALWLTGALFMAFCAFLAAGFVDDDQAEAKQPAPATKELTPKTVANIAGSLDTTTPEDTPKKSWRTTKRIAKAPQGPGVGSVWKTIGALVLVLILVFVGAAFGTRILKKVRMRPQGSKVLELVDVIPLGPKKQVFVISAYGRRLVVGATGDSMSVLSEFGADEIEATESGRPLDFSEKLNTSMTRRPSQRLASLEMEA